MLYNMFPNPCKYTNIRLRRLRRRLDGVCDTPLQSWYTDILRIKMCPGRGVSHTPSERFQKKRRDTPRHKNDHSPPPATSGGRMRYAPTLPDNREQKTKNKKGIPITSEFQKLDFPLVWYSFLALMQEKNQKKIKASGTPAKFETFRGPNVPGKLPSPRQRAFSCLDARKELKKKNQGVRDASQV